MKFAAKNHRFGEKTATSAEKMANFLKNAKFDENFEIRERCKGVHCVDLGESFPTNIFLQKLASIQRNTSPDKFDPTRDLFFYLCDPTRVEFCYLHPTRIEMRTAHVEIFIN